MPVPPFWQFVDSFPSDGATRVATTTNRPRTSTTDHAQSGMAPMNNIRCMNDLVELWTSHEVDEIECFIDKNCCRSCKKQYMWCPLANDRTIISIASFE